MERFTDPLLQNFRNFFGVSMATSEQMKCEAYRIRYRVYCEDMQFEPGDRFADHLERDEFDTQALHCLVIHRGSGRPAACVRLVEASDGAGLPFEKHCLGSLYTRFAAPLYERRESVCEFSRLAIDRDFRRRPGEDRTRMGEVDALDCSHKERRTFSLIGITTTLAAFAMAELNGRHRVFAMMEPQLPRLLRRSGIHLQQAGDFTEYHGRRALYFTTVEQVVAHLRPELREFYNALHDEFRAQMAGRENVA